MPNYITVFGLVTLGLLAGCASKGSRAGASAPHLTGAAYSTSYRQAEEAGAAIAAGAYPRALALADQALATSPDNAWAHYDRAVALGHLGRIDQAVQSFAEAERRFAASKDVAGQGIAIFGRAHALSEAGRCPDATAAFSEYASFVRGSDKRAAEMALEYARACKAGAPVVGDPVMTKVNSAILARDYPQALELTNQASDESKRSGWVDYNRAIALDGLDRIDDAVGAYRAAEARFAEGGDAHGRAISIYGRARALDRDKRCAEARQAYEQYAALVRPTDPKAADAAMEIQRVCAVR